MAPHFTILLVNKHFAYLKCAYLQNWMVLWCQICVILLFYLKTNVLQYLYIQISVPLQWLALHIKLIFQPRQILKSTIAWHITHVIPLDILNRHLLDSTCAYFHVFLEVKVRFFSHVLYIFIKSTWTLSGFWEEGGGPQPVFSLQFL